MNQIISWLFYFSLASGSSVSAPTNHMGDIVIDPNQNTIFIPYTPHNRMNPVYDIVKQSSGDGVKYYYCKANTNKYMLLIVSVYDDYVVASDPYNLVTYDNNGSLTEVRDVAVFYRNKNAVTKLSKEQAIQAGAKSARVFGWQ